MDVTDPIVSEELPDTEAIWRMPDLRI